MFFGLSIKFAIIFIINNAVHYTLTLNYAFRKIIILINFKNIP